MVFPLKYFLHHQSLAVQLLPEVGVTDRLFLILCVHLVHALVQFPLKQYKLQVFTTYCDKEFPVLNIHYLTCPYSCHNIQVHFESEILIQVICQATWKVF